MRKIEFVPVILTDVTDIFTIRIDNDTLTEFHKFLIMFKDTQNPYLKDDLFRIESAIKQIAQNPSQGFVHFALCNHWNSQIVLHKNIRQITDFGWRWA